MKFWETHSKEMRRARLLAASAIIYAQRNYGFGDAVDAALSLESRIDFKLQQAKKAEEKE